MSEFLKIILSLSVSGTLLVLLILGLDRFGRKRFSRRWQYYIWIAAVLRFLLPIAPETTLVGSMFETIDATVRTHESAEPAAGLIDPGGSAGSVSESGSGQLDSGEPAGSVSDSGAGQLISGGSTGSASGSGAGQLDSGEQAGSVSDSGAGQLISGGSAGNAADGGESRSDHSGQMQGDKIEMIEVIARCLFCAWFAVALVLFGRRITVYHGFVRYIRAGNTEVSDAAILDRLSDCAERLHIRTRVELSQNALITSPMLIGFFRPCIVLPDRELEERDLSYVLVHELIHYKHKDMFYKWLVQIAVCLHWFNPFVYRMAKEINRSCELCCDEAVLSVFGDGARREYGDMLIAFVKAGSPYRHSLVSVTLTEGAESLRERLGAIMKYKKKRSKGIRAAMAVCTTVVCACFMAAGAYAAPSAAHEEKESVLQTAAGSDSSNSRYTYAHRGFYMDSYIIEMGWNLTDTMGIIENAGSREITLADRSRIVVYFGGMPFGGYTGNAAAYMDDADVVSAVTKLIDFLKSNPLPNHPAIEVPWISNVTYVGADLPALVDEYLESGDAMGFAAVFAVLDASQQEEYCQKLYDSDQIALFAAILPYLDREQSTLYAEQAYQDRRMNFFSVLLQQMDPADRNKYAEKFYEANDVAQFSHIMFFMTQSQKQEWLMRAESDQKSSFSAVLSW